MFYSHINFVLKIIVNLNDLNATTFSYLLPKTGAHLVKNYDFRRKL